MKLSHFVRIKTAYEAVRSRAAGGSRGRLKSESVLMSELFSGFFFGWQCEMHREKIYKMHLARAKFVWTLVLARIV